MKNKRETNACRTIRMKIWWANVEMSLQDAQDSIIILLENLDFIFYDEYFSHFLRVFRSSKIFVNKKYVDKFD